MENIEAMTNCDIAPTCNNNIKKKVGRKTKYATDEERKKAKQEQTNKSLRKIYDKLLFLH